MLTYTLDPHGDTPLYAQLCRGIKGDIASGTLKAGDKLPSKRMLAAHLKISVITVENAYSQLIGEGYLFSREKSGYFVSPVEAVCPPATAADTVKLPHEAEPEWFMDFRRNATGAAHFPFSVWAKTMRQELLIEGKRLLEPLPFNGCAALREAIAGYLYRLRGMRVDPEQILIGAGTEYLYTLIIQLLGRDQVYAVENPGYPKIRRIYVSNGVRCVPVALDEQGLSAAELAQSDADIVHISPAHHFPTGTVMPIARRQAMLRWAGERDDRYIIEDDYDSEFRFSGRPIPTLFSIDHGGKVIYMNTFSKTIAPSMRISYMVLPEALCRRFRETLSFYACTVPAFEQYTLADFIVKGSFEQHINRMRTLYRKKRDAVIAALAESPLAPLAAVREENAGLHFLLALKTAVPDEVLRERAEKQGLRLAFLSDYLYETDNRSDHILIVNYSGLELVRWPEALRRLAELLRGAE